MSSIKKDIGIYDNKKKYAFTNWSNRDFVYTWGGEGRTVKAGEVVELPEYLAYHATKHFVDREIIKDDKSNLLSIPELRKQYEEKTIVEIVDGMESPVISSMKERIRIEVEKEMKAQAEGAITNTGDTNPVVEKKSAGRPKKEFANA